MKDYSFGNFICALRTRRGLSQFQLGTLVGVSGKAVSKWENGAAKPQLSTCRKLAEVLGISLDELLSCKYLSYSSARKEDFAMNHALWEKAYSRLKDIYGPNPPVEMMGRFETEKLLMNGSGLMAHFGYIASLSDHIRQMGSHISLRGKSGNSFVAWLLGATNVNPLTPHYLCSHCKRVEFHDEALDGWDLPPARCACGHMMYADGHRLPCEAALMQMTKAPFFEIDIAPGMLKEAEQRLREHFGDVAQVVRIRIENEAGGWPDRYVLLDKSEPQPPDVLSTDEYFKRYSGKARYTFCKSMMAYCIQELCRESSRTPDRIDFLSGEVMDAFAQADMPDELEYSAEALRSLLVQLRPRRFSEILKAEGLKHSTCAWDDNQAPLWEAGELSAAELVAYQEDVYDAVSAAAKCSPGSLSSFANRIMHDTHMGIYYRKGMPSETEAALRAIGISERYIASLKKVLYLFPRAHGIGYLRSQMILMWFYVHEKELFGKYCCGYERWSERMRGSGIDTYK